MKTAKFTDTQEKQLEFLDKMDAKESLGSNRQYLCVCKTCEKAETMHAAGTVSALWLPEHIGHKTWIKIL